MAEKILVIKHCILKALAVLNIKSFCAYLCTLTRMRFLLDYFEMVYFVKPYVDTLIYFLNYTYFDIQAGPNENVSDTL